MAERVDAPRREFVTARICAAGRWPSSEWLMRPSARSRRQPDLAGAGRREPDPLRGVQDRGRGLAAGSPQPRHRRRTTSRDAVRFLELVVDPAGVMGWPPCATAIRPSPGSAAVQREEPVYKAFFPLAVQWLDFADVADHRPGRVLRGPLRGPQRSGLPESRHSPDAGGPGWASSRRLRRFEIPSGRAVRVRSGLGGPVEEQRVQASGPGTSAALPITRGIPRPAADSPPDSDGAPSSRG